MRARVTGMVPALALVVVGGLGATAPAVRAESVRLDFGRGSLQVEVVPDRGSALAFRRDRPDQWSVTRDLSPLMGTPYSIRLTNRSTERIKVVVAIDGLNVLFKQPVRGLAREDLGYILSPRRAQTVAGWQVSELEGQRFELSPGHWSEGQSRWDDQVGLIEIHVYEQDRRPAPRTDEVGSPEENAASSVGTTSGEDFENEVRHVRFRAATREPIARAVLQYGRPAPPHRGDRLGVSVVQDRGGLRVVEVAPHSLADEVGLRVGDVITSVNDDGYPSPVDLRDATNEKTYQRGNRGYLLLEVERGPHGLTMKISLR